MKVENEVINEKTITDPTPERVSFAGAASKHRHRIAAEAKKVMDDVHALMSTQCAIRKRDQQANLVIDEDEIWTRAKLYCQITQDDVQRVRSRLESR